MPPRPQAPRRNPQSSQNEHVYALGVVGRKTGVTLHDTGERDEYGMEPADNLFSSPDKENGSRGATDGNRDGSSDNEQDMELDEDVSPGPATVSRMRKARVSLPKARSPGKTSLNSPARHNPHVGRTSSPIRGSIADDQRSSPMKPANRRLNFSKDPKIKPSTNGASSKAKSGLERRPASQPTKTNGRVHEESSDVEDEIVPLRRARSAESERIDEDDEEEVDPMEFLDMAGDDMDPPAGGEDEEQPEEEEEDEADEEEEEEPVPVQQPKKRGRKPRALPKSPEPAEKSPEIAPRPAAAAASEPEKKKRGRAAKRPPAEEPEPAAKPVKRARGRPSLTKQNASPEAASSAAPVKGKPEALSKAKASSAKAPATKGKGGRPRKLSGAAAESPVIKPRPPMPKRRSLVSQRRDDFGIKTTRSGRVSTKPLEFWRGEHYDYEDDENEYVQDQQGRRIKVGSKIKGVVRVEYDEDEPKPRRRRGRPPSGAVGRPKKREMDEEDEEREAWEEDPGRITGECILWYPEYEVNPPGEEEQVEVVEEELAIAESAIQLKDIKDATFRFAKTLTLPFFGSGLVDLPPHSEKRMKNNRKMQMVFFMHYGNVEVTVSSSTFRIGKGGTWFVPRGNSYSILNDTDRPARLFFCQGCEVLVQPGPDSQEL